MPTWELAVGATSASTFSTTNRFSPPAGFLTASLTETHQQVKVYSSYTWANLYARCLTWATANHVIRSRIGAVNGNMTVTVTGTGVFQDTVNTDSLVDQNLINWILESSTGNKSYAMLGSTLQDTGSNITLQMNNQQSGGTNITFGITRFAPISGRLISATGAASTETNVQYTIRRATTYSNLRAFVGTNTFDGATTWNFRINAGAGAQSLSIGAGLTGAFEDTTNTDAVAVGDEINYSIVTTASTSGVIIVPLSQLKHTSTSRETASAQPIGVAVAADRFFGAEGQCAEQSSEANSQIAARATFTANNLFVNITAHGASSGVDGFFRVNGANSALTVNIPASTTGLFEDTTNSVSVAVADTYNYFLDHGGGVGTITPTIIGMAQGLGGARRRVGYGAGRAIHL